MLDKSSQNIIILFYYWRSFAHTEKVSLILTISDTVQPQTQIRVNFPTKHHYKQFSYEIAHQRWSSAWPCFNFRLMALLMVIIIRCVGEKTNHQRKLLLISPHILLTDTFEKYSTAAGVWAPITPGTCRQLQAKFMQRGNCSRVSSAVGRPIAASGSRRNLAGTWAKTSTRRR